eukprot:gene27251-33943_t
MDANGERKPCIPPRVGYMCNRESVLLKAYLVRLKDKEDRVWQAYKASGLEDAVKRAESEAKVYLESMEGKDWLEAVAYEQAEEMLMDLGATHAVTGRQKNVEKKKKKIISRFDAKKARVQKARDGKIGTLQTELNKFKEDRKVVKEGINDLTTRMANLPETIELNMLQEECERECQMAEDALFDNDSDDSMNPSEAADSDQYSSEDSSAEAQRFRYRLKRYKEKLADKERLQKIQDHFKAEAKPLTGTLAIAANIVKKTIIKPIITPVVTGVSDTVHRTHKGFKRSVRHIKEVSAMRTRKLFNTVNGNFDEIQKELKYEIYYQYITHQVTLARNKARHEFSVIDTVRQNVQGTGKENAFRAWVKWVYTKKQRIRRDIRSNWKSKTKGFDAAMASVTSAQVQVDMWLKNYDIYSDRPFWRHSVKDDVTFDKPGIQHFLPTNFEIPTPPEELPAGITIDTSSDESESNWQRRRDAERIQRAAAKKLLLMEKQNAEAAMSGEEDNSSESSNSKAKPKARRRRNASSSSSNSSSDDSNTEKFLDTLYDAADNNITPAFNHVYNEQDEAYDKIAHYSPKNNTLQLKLENNASSVAGNSSASQKLLDAVAKARYYMENSEFYRTRKNTALPDENKSNIYEVAEEIAHKANNEFESASKNIRKKRNQLNPVRHHTYMTQMNRKARSFEQIKADQLKAENDAKAEHMIEVAEGVFVDSRDINMFAAPTESELLKLAGGDLTMIQTTGKAGGELRTILAQRALHVRKRMKEKAIEKGLLPAKPTFYKREIHPFFTGNYHGSSSEESEDEEEIKRLKAERKIRRREERAERNKTMAKMVKDQEADEELGLA